MRTRTAPAGHPREDRLERLLRTGGELPAVIDPRDHEDQDDRLARGRHRAAQVPLLSVPPSLRSAELHVGVRAVRGLLVLVVVAVLVLGGRWLWTQRVAAASESDRVVTSQAGTGGASAGEESGGDDAAGSGTGTGETTTAGDGSAQDASAEHVGEVPADAGAGTGDAGTGESTPSSDLVVHVAGEVVEPGVVQVPAGSRVVDAVRAAGGTTGEADESTLNLARPLVDGERVWVGRPGEVPPVAPGPLPDATTGGSAGEGAGGAGQTTPLDLNAATQADLEELPGIGPVTAGHILGWREEHGRFSSVDELLEVSGIGERTLAQLEPLVTVGG